MKICSIEGCENKNRTNGFCRPHYDIERRKGGSLDPCTEERIRSEKRRSFERCLKDAGWTEDRFIAFNYAQGGLCYLCVGVSYQKERPMRLCMDHDHDTNEPRGLLCQKCNSAIWLYENSDMAARIESYIR